MRLPEPLGALRALGAEVASGDPIEWERSAAA